MSQPPGPKELALRAMREDRHGRRPAPSKSELRQQIAKIKGSTKVHKSGGRKR